MTGHMMKRFSPATGFGAKLAPVSGLMRHQLDPTRNPITSTAAKTTRPNFPSEFQSSLGDGTQSHSEIGNYFSNTADLLTDHTFVMKLKPSAMFHLDLGICTFHLRATGLNLIAILHVAEDG